MRCVIDPMISGGALEGGGAGAWVDVVLNRNDNNQVVVILTTKGNGGGD